MDTTETNIKMCEKAAPDLMGGRIIGHCWQLGDWYWNGYAVYLVCNQSRQCERQTLEAEGIWLPCQDQLQEMVEVGENLEAFEVGRANRIRYQLQGFASNNLDYSNRFTTMEQLWLAFVMKEKYNKVWDGYEWTLFPEGTIVEIKNG